MIKTRVSLYLHAVYFPAGYPASANREHITYAIKIFFDAPAELWRVHRWEPDNWIEVGEYSTKEEADQAAEVVYNMRLFSR